METTSTNMIQIEEDIVSDLAEETNEIEDIVGHVESNTLSDLNAVDVSRCLEGLKASSWKDFIPLYTKHAATLGFNFKKSTSRSDENGKIIEKYFRCSCSGTTNAKENPKKKRKINEIRCGCQAHLRLKLIDGLFIVAKHNMLHNHNLTRLGWQYLHRIERKISEEKGEAIKLLDSAGVKPATAYRYLTHTAGGEDIVGHTEKDHYNFVNRFRTNSLYENDAQTVFVELRRLQKENPEFYYSTKLDDEGKLCALYWRDPMMKNDYDIYGDVIIFDSTYKTNRYDLICAPFVGVNNHWSTVMFACAFIANEQATTFEWLLEEFLTSMGNKKPETILTDQDLAMSKAIEKVLGEDTKHRLCLWHLYQNAISHYGALKTNKEFKAAFAHCLSGCSNISEFTECWSNMITKFGLEGNTWFDRLYNIKEKWCTGLSKDFFLAGILSSQRSESTNNAISFNATRNTSLTQFFEIFSKTIKKWRSTEKKNEFTNSFSTPKSGVSTGILKHAAQIYTSTIFRFFEEEFEACLVSTTEVSYAFGTSKIYAVSPEDDTEKNTPFCFITMMGKRK